MKKPWFLALLYVILIVVFSDLVSASSRSVSTFRYDRVQLLERLLRVLYPTLVNDRLAMFNITATMEGNQGVTLRNVTFYPCSSGGSVSVPTIEVTGPLDKGRQLPLAEPNSRMPRCGEEPTREFEHFLDVSVGSTESEKHPIFRFHASGSNVDAKLQELREQFAGKSYPSDDEALQALRLKTPKYGPDNRKAFLDTLHPEQIERLTGCRLHPESAAFVVELEQNPQHLLPDLQWHISGKAPATAGLPATDCWATFEPFEGHLTMFMD